MAKDTREVKELWEVIVDWDAEEETCCECDSVLKYNDAEDTWFCPNSRGCGLGNSYSNRSFGL